MSKYGLPGFDGGEPDFALGSVTGVRWWHLRMPDGPDGSPDLSLAGVHASDPWRPGENTARCASLVKGYEDHEVPDAGCACGFWAYWAVPDAPNPHNFGIPVLGVIEGYGRTLIGDRGFRCARARITALHFTSDAATWTKDDHRAGYRGYPRFRTEAAVATWEQLCGRRNGKGYRRLDPDEAMARMAGLEMVLEERYGVPVYLTRGLMLARHPPTADYLPPGKRPAPSARRILTGAEAMARILAAAEPASDQGSAYAEG